MQSQQMMQTPGQMEAAAQAAACAPVCNPLSDFSARFAQEGCEPAFPGCAPVLPPPCAPYPGAPYPGAPLQPAPTGAAFGDEFGATAAIGAAPGEAALIEKDFDPADKTRHRTINLTAHWQFSLADAEANPALLTWQVPPGVRKLLAADGSNPDKAVLIGINIGRVRSSHAVTLGFVPKIKRANGSDLTMPGSDLTDGGEATAFTIMAGTSAPDNLNIVIHTAGNETYTASYQHLGATEESLREDLLPKKSEDYTYVPVSHDITDAIIKNADRLKLKVTSMHVIDGALKVSNQLVDRVIGAITEVSNNLPVVQLPTFSLTAVRTDGQPIGSPTNVERLGPNGEVRAALRNDTQVAEAKIQLVYMPIPDNYRRGAQ